MIKSPERGFFVFALCSKHNKYHMNIEELDSYNLGDAVKFHNELNPKLWAADEHLQPQVHRTLLEIAADFQEFLGIRGLDVEDITISGSNAAYNYTNNSDIDLHLIVDLPDGDVSDVYRELFDAKKFQYNQQRDIKIGGYKVELYVQDPHKEHHSQGIYSVKNLDWISVPRKRKAAIDDVSVRSKYEDLVGRINCTVKEKDHGQIDQLFGKIKQMRQSGLDQQGEFGADNLAFKMLRAQGHIQKLVDARNSARDAELSLTERNKKKTRVQYGYGSNPVQEASTPDGVSASTKLFVEQQVPEVGDIVSDFVKYCVDQLEIAQAPQLQLRRDPEWSKRNKSFGQFDTDSNKLNVSIADRHVMDILRTVAHELVHYGQQEHSTLPPGAGATGSDYENEANAQAGVLMRDYAQMHPEYFDTNSLDESSLSNMRDYFSKVDPARPVVPNAINSKMPPEIVDILTRINNSQIVSKEDYYKLLAFRKPQQAPAIAVETIDVESIHNDMLRKHLLSNPALYENREDFRSMREFLNLHVTKSPVTGGQYVYASVQITPISQFSTVAYFDKAHKLVDLNDQFAYFEINGSIKRFPESGKLTGDSMAQIYFFKSNNEFKQFITLLKLKFSHYKLASRILDEQSAEESVAESSGYIPTTKQKNDSRFSMALSPDVRPGATGLNANRMSLKTDRQGRPAYIFKSVNQVDKRITEVLDTSAADLTWKKQVGGTVAHFTTSNGVQYQLFILVPGSGPEEMSPYDFFDDDISDKEYNQARFVEFEIQSAEPHAIGKQGIEGTGSAAEVFGIVTNALIQYIKQYNPSMLYFQAVEPGRVKLYVAIAKRLLQTMPGWALATANNGHSIALYNQQIVNARDMAAEHSLAESLAWEFSQLPAHLPRTAVNESIKDLFEINMSPRSLRAQASQIGAMAGMEFEMFVPEIDTDDNGDSERDYDRDDRADSIQAVLSFFADGEYNSINAISRLETSMNEDFSEWVSEKENDDWESDGQRGFREYTIRNEIDMDEINDQADKEITAANPDLPSGTQDFFQLRNARVDEIIDDAVDNSWDAQDRNYESAREDFQDNNSGTYDEGDWLSDVGITLMSDIENRYSIEWPHYINNNDSNLDEVGEEFSTMIGRPVNTSSTYHGGTRTSNGYVIEPDGSLESKDPDYVGLEFISPPMPIDQMISDLNKVKAWADDKGVYTNESTGLHINVSIPKYNAENVDYVKLALMLGDEYVLKLFGRAGNSYATSALAIVKERVIQNPEAAAELLQKMRNNLESIATKAIHNGTTRKFTSINNKRGYIEFRSPGGDWLNENFDKIENTLLRFVVALDSAMDPQKNREEYLTKLYKLLEPTGYEYGAMVKDFSDYVAGVGGAPQQVVKNFRRASLAALQKGSIKQAAPVQQSNTGPASNSVAPPAAGTLPGSTQDLQRQRAAAQAVNDAQPQRQWQVMMGDQQVFLITAATQGEANEKTRQWLTQRSAEFNAEYQGQQAEVIPLNINEAIAPGFNVYTARVKVKNPNYSTSVDVAVFAKSPAMARLLLKGQYGEESMVSNVTKIA